MTHIPLILKSGSHLRFPGIQGFDSFVVLVDFDLVEHAKLAGIDFQHFSGSDKDAYFAQMQFASHLIDHGLIKLLIEETNKLH